MNREEEKSKASSRECAACRGSGALPDHGMPINMERGETRSTCPVCNGWGEVPNDRKASALDEMCPECGHYAVACGLNPLLGCMVLVGDRLCGCKHMTDLRGERALPEAWR